MVRSRYMKWAAVFAWLSGLGFGLPAIPAISYFAEHEDVWTFIGFPTYGEGPFEDVGLDTSVPLLALFLLVCVAEVVMGWLLWTDRRLGVLLAIGLLPIEFAFWLGFALPLGPAFGIVRTALVIAGVRASRPHRTE
jgi:hypothetical protein